MKKTMYGIVLLGLIASSAGAATLLPDQQGATNVAGGYNSPVVQTFMPGENNMAGLDVFISGTAVLTEDITVNLYSSADLLNPIATDSILDHPRNTFAAFRWDAVAVIPDTTYFLQFFTGSLNIGVFVSNTVDQYSRGNVIQGGGNLGFTYRDAVFTTYYDSEFSVVPVPAAAWLFGSALGVMGWMRRKATI